MTSSFVKIAHFDWMKKDFFLSNRKEKNDSYLDGKPNFKSSLIT